MKIDGEIPTTERLFIIWVDPGVTNGIVLWNDGAIQVWGQVSFDELSTTLSSAVIQLRAHNHDPHILIGCERFVITANTHKKPYAVETIQAWGVVKAIALHFETAYEDSQKSNVKNFITDDKLKRLGGFKFGMKHANDAARHVFYYLAESGLLSPAEVDMVLPQYDEEGSDDVGRHR